MDEYTTRIAGPEDASAIETLLRASYPRLMAVAYDQAVLSPVLELITQTNISLLSSGTYYVAEARGGPIIGCGGWTMDRPPGIGDVASGAGHLRHFATHPDWIRRGVGRSIYIQCDAAARLDNVNVFEVISSFNGEKFYAALGFERIRVVSAAIGPNTLPCVLMRRAI